MEDNIKEIISSKDFTNLYDSFIELQKDCDISFNIFTMISDKYHLENMHTDIIKCFLGSNEGHDEGNKFLFLFIDMINTIGKEGININKDFYVNAKVESQYLVDYKGQKGFIDILISGDNHCIIFENKINNASDTYNQLPKYYGFCSQEYTVDAIVYLPLNDYKTPDNGTWDDKLAKETEEKLIVLSAFKYNEINFIDNWIIPCSSKTNNIHCISILRQYSNLVKSLKKETMSESLLYLLLENNIDIHTFMDIANGIPKAMLTFLLKQLHNDEDLKEFKRASNDSIFCEYRFQPYNVHIDVLIQNYQYYLRVFEMNYNDFFNSKDFSKEINLGLDGENKYYKKYRLDTNTINNILNDIKQIDEDIQTKLRSLNGR